MLIRSCTVLYRNGIITHMKLRLTVIFFSLMTSNASRSRLLTPRNIAISAVACLVVVAVVFKWRDAQGVQSIPDSQECHDTESVSDTRSSAPCASASCCAVSTSVPSVSYYPMTTSPSTQYVPSGVSRTNLTQCARMIVSR